MKIKTNTKLLSLARFLDLVDFRVGIPSVPLTSSSSSWAISALSVYFKVIYEFSWAWTKLRYCRAKWSYPRHVELNVSNGVLLSRLNQNDTFNLVRHGSSATFEQA